MKYFSGDVAHLWDRVEVAPGIRGVVVFAIDTDEYSPDFPKDAWSYLGGGVMVDTEDAGLVHYEVLDDEVRLIARGGPLSPAEIVQLRSRQALALKPRDPGDSR